MSARGRTFLVEYEAPFESFSAAGLKSPLVNLKQKDLKTLNIIIISMILLGELAAVYAPFQIGIRPSLVEPKAVHRVIASVYNSNAKRKIRASCSQLIFLELRIKHGVIRILFVQATIMSQLDRPQPTPEKFPRRFSN